jgi:hypothetical protein
LELQDDAKDADALVLVEVVEIRDGDDALGGDRFVVLLDPCRRDRLAEVFSRVGTDSDKLGEPLDSARPGSEAVSAMCPGAA